MKRSLKKRLFLTVVTLFVVVAFAGFSVLVFWPYRIPGKAVTVEVPFGASPRSVARVLSQHSVVRSAEAFYLLSRLTGWSDQLRAGVYRFQGRTSCLGVLRQLRSGHGLMTKVTIPEGARSWEVASILQRTVRVDSARFMRLVHSDSVAHAYGVDAPGLEGYLYPDTYLLAPHVAPEKALEAMVKRFWQVVDDSIPGLARAQGFTLHQVVTLASLIEGEAKVDSERALISAVYRNRLRKGMLLQACPTIQYILRGPRRRLLLDDLKIDSPYNTYRHRGLPPGPVNNPGLRSITAALHPARVDYLYFVADGEGGHYFSRTLAQHLRYKAKLDALRRRLAREKRNHPEKF